MRARGVPGLLVLSLVTGCHSDSFPRATSATSAAATNGVNGSGGEWFVDRANDSGLRFTYFNGMSGEYYFEEILGFLVPILNLACLSDFGLVFDRALFLTYLGS